MEELNDIFGLVGTELDRDILVEAVVGEGGFGVVYRAHHRPFDSPVAVKVLKLPTSLTPAQRDTFLEKFGAEAKILFRLAQSSLHVARAISVGAVQTKLLGWAPYYVLEWLEGETLEDHLARRRARGQSRRSLHKAVALLSPIVDALVQAHELGVVHRDLKPSNIFLAKTSQGVVPKLLDFGVAKMMRDGTMGAALRTAPGFNPFTPAYAAPEQWSPKRFGEVSIRTDVYSFALITLELMSSDPPVGGLDAVEVMHNALSSNRPTPRQLGLEVSDEVEASFETALALHPSHRPASLRSWWQSLQGLASNASMNDFSGVLAPQTGATIAGAPLVEDPGYSGHSPGSNMWSSVGGDLPTSLAGQTELGSASDIESARIASNPKPVHLPPPPARSQRSAWPRPALTMVVVGGVLCLGLIGTQLLRSLSAGRVASTDIDRAAPAVGVAGSSPIENPTVKDWASQVAKLVRAQVAASYRVAQVTGHFTQCSAAHGTHWKLKLQTASDGTLPLPGSTEHRIVPGLECCFVLEPNRTTEGADHSAWLKGWNERNPKCTGVALAPDHAEALHELPTSPVILGMGDVPSVLDLLNRDVVPKADPSEATGLDAIESVCKQALGASAAFGAIDGCVTKQAHLCGSGLSCLDGLKVCSGEETEFEASLLGSTNAELEAHLAKRADTIQRFVANQGPCILSGARHGGPSAVGSAVAPTDGCKLQLHDRSVVLIAGVRDYEVAFDLDGKPLGLQLDSGWAPFLPAASASGDSGNWCAGDQEHQRFCLTAPTGSGSGSSDMCSKCTEGVSSSALNSKLQSIAGSTQGCYNRALRSGKITVSVQVGANGSVCNASIANDTVGSGEISSCVLGKFRGASLPPPEQGCVTLNVPINFKIAGE